MNTLVHFDQMRSESWCISSHCGFHGLLGKANRRKMAVGLELIQLWINQEAENKHFEGGFYLNPLKVFDFNYCCSVWGGWG